MMQAMYLTKYALSEGIRKVNVEMVGDGYANAYLGGRSRVFVRAADVHETVAAATAAAIKARDRKVASLEKQIARLKAMTFDTVREG